MFARALALATLLFGVRCTPDSALVGTWRYSLETVIHTPTGPMNKAVMFDLDLDSSASADLVVWRVGGGCNVGLALVGKVASLQSPAALCGVSAGATLPMIADTGTVVKTGDQLGVNAARFELLDDGKLSTRFDYKLYTNLQDARVGPLFVVTTPDGKHGTRVK